MEKQGKRTAAERLMQSLEEWESGVTEPVGWRPDVRGLKVSFKIDSAVPEEKRVLPRSWRFGEHVCRQTGRKFYSKQNGLIKQLGWPYDKANGRQMVYEQTHHLDRFR